MVALPTPSATLYAASLNWSSATGAGMLYSTVRTGRSAATLFSLESKRFVDLMPSSPLRSHPKLLDGLSSHPWTSAPIWGVGPQV